MNSPAYVVTKMGQRLQYNLGRVQKELGLRKLLPLTLSNIDTDLAVKIY